MKYMLLTFVLFLTSCTINDTRIYAKKTYLRSIPEANRDMIYQAFISIKSSKYTGYDVSVCLDTTKQIFICTDLFVFNLSTLKKMIREQGDKS